MATTHDCCSDDGTPYWEAETEGFCNSHCNIGSTRQNGSRLRVEIKNLHKTSTYYGYITLQSNNDHLQHHPEFVICRHLPPKQFEPVDFDVWHKSPQTNVTVNIEVKLRYTRTWRVCNSQKNDKTVNLQSMNLTLEPEFKYV